MGDDDSSDNPAAAAEAQLPTTLAPEGKCRLAVDVVAVVLSFAQRRQQLLLRLVCRRWSVALSVSLHSLTCRRVSDAQLATTVTSFPHLRSLSLQWCERLTSAGLAHLSRLSYLRSLRFGTSQLRFDAVSCLGVLGSLTAVDFSPCESLSAPQLAKLLGHWPALQSLGLRRTNTTDDVLRAVADCLPVLASLDLSCCRNAQFTERGLEALTRVPGLTALNVDACHDVVNDRSVASIARMTGLRDLNLDHCRAITDAAMAHVQALPHLTSLSVRDCGHITEAGFARLGEMKALQTIALSVTAVTDATLELLSTLPAVTALDICDCYAVTNTGLFSVSRMSTLTSLNLRGCKLTDISGIGSLPRLTALDLSLCWSLTSGYMATVGGMKSLKTVDISGLPPLNTNDVESLRTLRCLSELVVQRGQLSTDQVGALCAALPRLRVK